eukprot:CAMPEP_0168315694 /NCGR_PEP_ID=MMETSP0210-20121227/12342_1 /TAXON_ID=40633 /ORGANISM="Condylostoma magnum, Strain COL2" /LENGTH=136 /DNA_ID=CAMNT_0008290797 /DNA_START=2166 /DNA_END=2576 /DNA_ORIENTATION=-
MAPDDDKGGLKEFEIRNWIENVYKQSNKGHIDDYTFASYPFESLYEMGPVNISVLSGFPAQNTELIGIEENYLNSIYQEFYIPTESDGDFDFPELSNGEIDLVAGIYDDEGIDNYMGDPDYYNILTGKTERLYTTR